MKGLELIQAERRRQIDAEGWSANHDDDHEDRVLEAAAFSYFLSAQGFAPEDSPPTSWPWEREWWKPSTKVRDLTKAGALYLAAADRYHRLAQPRNAEKQREHAAKCAAAIDLCSESTGDPEKPRLFYFEEGVDAWIPVPFPHNEIPGIESVENFTRGEERELRLRRVDMTDAEFAALPESC